MSPALASEAVAPSTSIDRTVPSSLEGMTLTAVPTLTAPPSSFPPTEMPPLCPLKTSVMGILKGLLMARSEGLKALIASTTDGPCTSQLECCSNHQMQEWICKTLKCPILYSSKSCYALGLGHKHPNGSCTKGSLLTAKTRCSICKLDTDLVRQ